MKPHAPQVGTARVLTPDAVQRLRANEAPAPAPLLEPGAQDVRERLERAGASRPLIRRVLRDVKASGRRGAFAIDAAARSIGGLFRVARPRKTAGRAYVVALVGPTGAGKTTTLAKLGRRLAEAGRRVVFVSLDPVGLTALESVGGVGADVDRLEVPILAVRDGRELARTVRRHADADLILVDTPGLSPRDAERVGELARELGRVERDLAWDTYLVLPASASRSALALTVRGLSPLAPTACVLTKLDETDQPSGVLEESLRARLPIAFLADGQDVRSHLVRPRAGHFADLLLRGRLA